MENSNNKKVIIAQCKRYYSIVFNFHFEWKLNFNIKKKLNSNWMEKIQIFSHRLYDIKFLCISCQFRNNIIEKQNHKNNHKILQKNCWRIFYISFGFGFTFYLISFAKIMLQFSILKDNNIIEKICNCLRNAFEKECILKWLFHWKH